MNEWLEAERRVERAQELSESHRWAEALVEIEAALTINPHNSLWHAHRGFLHEQLDHHEEAAASYQRSLELDPEERDVSLALGLSLIRLGRFAKALKVFAELAKRYPDFEPAYCHRIGLYAELGRHDRAEEMFYLAQQLDDRCPHCFFHLGTSLAARGLLKRAVYCFQRVLELEPAYIGVHRQIGQAFRAEGDLAGARKHFVEELRDDPGNVDLMYEMAELALESGRERSALARLRQIVELAPDHVESWYLMGKIHIRRGQASRALTCFERVLGCSDSEETNLPQISTNMGEALYRLGRFEEAACRFDAAMIEDAPCAEGMVRAGDCHLALGRYEEAADRYRRALALDAGLAAAHQSLALCLIRAGATEAGLRHSLEALRADPESPLALYGTALAYLRMGQWRKARAVFQTGRRVAPENEALKALSATAWRLRARSWLGRLRSILGLRLGG